MSSKMLRFDEMINKIAEETGATKKRSAEVINLFLDIIDGELQKGNDVRLKGIGRFCVRTSKAKIVNNTYFGIHRILPPKKYIHFRCSKKMLQRLNHNLKVSHDK